MVYFLVGQTVDPEVWLRSIEPDEALVRGCSVEFCCATSLRVNKRWSDAEYFGATSKLGYCGALLQLWSTEDVSKKFLAACGLPELTVLFEQHKITGKVSTSSRELLPAFGQLFVISKERYLRVHTLNPSTEIGSCSAQQRRFREDGGEGSRR